MGAMPERTTSEKKSISILVVSGILCAIAVVGLAYMTVFVSPEEVVERVEVIAVTESGCIVETFDGYPVNIGQCDAQSGDIIMVPVDQKAKERAYAMNPTD